jgi:hypothetical protein
MNTLVLLAALLAVDAPPPKVAEATSTRLFVRTIPPGAEITLNGKPFLTIDPGDGGL